MRIRIFRHKIFSSALFSVFVAAAAMSFSAQARPLVYGSFLPPSAPGSKVVSNFINIVKKKTNDEVKFEFYPSGALTTGKETLGGIKNGLMDGGFIVSVYTPSSLPVNMLFSDMSFYNKDARVTTAAITDTVLNDCPACRKEWEKQNVHFLTAFSTPPYYAMCKGKTNGSFSARGLRMRAPGEELANWIKEIGAIPVHVENSEAYQALQRNTLDCAIGAQLWLRSLSLGEVVHTVVTLPMGGYQGGSGVNIAQSAWTGLDEKTQGIMKESALEAMAAAIYDYRVNDRAVVAESRKNGIKFIDAPADIAKKREAFMKSEKQRAIEKARSRGAKDPEAVMQAFQKNLKKWRSLIEGKKLSQEEYADLLVKNILTQPHG